MRQIYILIAISGLLVACQSLPEPWPGEPLLYESVSKGGAIALNRPVTIAANQARKFIQGGVEVTAQTVDRFYPNCDVEVRTLRPTPTVVQPDQFTVTRIRNPTEGSEGFSTGFMGGLGGGTIKYITEMRVQSQKQPDVLQITCSHEETASRGHHLTVNQFKTAVGGFMSIQ